MKKFVTVSVVVLLVLVMSGVVLAQEANSPENQVAVVLENISEKLDVGTEVLWEALKTQASIYVYTYIGYTVIFLVSVCTALLFRKRLADGIKSSDDLSLVLSLMFVSAFFVMGCLVLVNLANVITAVYNPEYWALQQILQMLR